MKYWFVLLLFFAACEESRTEPTGELELFCEVQTGVWVDTPPKLDILLVIDNSMAMETIQAQMPANLAQLASVLETLVRGLPSLHLGVVSGDAGASAALLNAPRLGSCVPPEDNHLRFDPKPYWACPDAPDACGEANYSGPIGQALACIGTLGSAGPEDQALFQSALRALDGSVAANDGFLREDAFLAIVFITNQDDDSPMNVEDYAAAIKLLKRDPGLVIVSSVRTAQSSRLIALEAEFRFRTSAALITEEWADALLVLAESTADLLGLPCLDTTLVDMTDISPEETGLQLDCAVSAGYPNRVTIPPCQLQSNELPVASTPLPCWWLAAAAGGPSCEYSPVIESAEYLANPAMACAGTCESI